MREQQTSAALTDLQRALEGVYRLDPAPAVTHFLLAPEPSSPREELLVLEEEDLYLGLALDPEVAPRLADPHLERDNLQDFCLAVEGVSHFLFVTFCARQHRSVSLLEIELQAEIDKWVAALVLARRAPGLSSAELRRALFEQFVLLDGLDRPTELRYLRANGLARHYTAALERRYVRTVRLAAMLVELRTFYRMGYLRKQEHIGD